MPHYELGRLTPPEGSPSPSIFLVIRRMQETGVYAGKGRVQGYVETHFGFFCTLYAQIATEAFPLVWSVEMQPGQWYHSNLLTQPSNPGPWHGHGRQHGSCTADRSFDMREANTIQMVSGDPSSSTVVSHPPVPRPQAAIFQTFSVKNASEAREQSALTRCVRKRQGPAASARLALPNRADCMVAPARARTTGPTAPSPWVYRWPGPRVCPGGVALTEAV